MEHINQADLDGAVVVVANCFGHTDPMVGALYDAGASSVIAGPGPNYAFGDGFVGGTDKLVRGIIKAMEAGKGVPSALQYAKRRLLLTAWRRADRDALQFEIMKRSKL
jgi:hypothetical protein